MNCKKKKKDTKNPKIGTIWKVEHVPNWNIRRKRNTRKEKHVK